MFDLIYVCDILQGAIQHDVYFYFLAYFLHFIDFTAAMEHLSVYFFSNKGSEYWGKNIFK